MDTKAFPQRLKDLRKAHGLTQKQLAHDLGLGLQTIVGYENGRRFPNASALSALEKYFDVTGSYLLGREDNSVTAADEPADSTGVLIPVLGYVRAGVPITAIENILDYEEITPEMARSGEFFALSVRGDSMEPRICEHDIVIVRQQSDVDSGDIAVVLINGSDATIKRVQKHPSGISLVPFNPSYATVFYTWQECEQLPVSIIGKVIELRGKF